MSLDVGWTFSRLWYCMCFSQLGHMTHNTLTQGNKPPAYKHKESQSQVCVSVSHTRWAWDFKVDLLDIVPDLHLPFVLPFLRSFITIGSLLWLHPPFADPFAICPQPSPVSLHPHSLIGACPWTNSSHASLSNHASVCRNISCSFWHVRGPKFTMILIQSSWSERQIGVWIYPLLCEMFVVLSESLKG